MRIATLEVGREQILVALDQRLREVAGILLGDVVDASGQLPGEFAATVLPDLVVAAGPRPGPRLWLLLVGLSGSFPEPEDIVRAARMIALEEPDDVALAMLDRIHGETDPGDCDRHITIVRGAVVVDVDGCATSDTHTGIQRVTRSVMPFWDARHDIVPVAHTSHHGAYRHIRAHERVRVFEFSSDIPDPDPAEATPKVVVPWESMVLWPEVPAIDMQRRLAGLAQFSGNRVGAVGYDMIPILTGHLRPPGEDAVFSRYLATIKHVDRVAGISNSATSEFHGFGRMLAAQGLRGPDVREVELAEDVPPSGMGERVVPSRPVVVIPGRREPHKNVRACVQAAHRLWAEGLEFDVVTLGGAGWSETSLDRTVADLKAAGYPLTTLGWVDDEEMWRRIRDASFVVFASQHEGYGLPISEALNLGTPVVTTNYGCQAEIGRRGGCLLVDPRDDTDIADAMRSLITDPDKLAALRAEIPLRPRRTWSDYADDLWSFLVAGEAR